jgi:serine/threonine protein kinase
MNPRRIGFRSDIWSTGVVLYELMTKTIFQTHVDVDNGNTVDKHFSQNVFKKTVYTLGGLQQFDTFGRDLLVRPYSMRLIDLAHKCLAWDAQRRPSSRQILRIATFTLNQVFKEADPPDPMVYLSENIPGARIFNHILLQGIGPGAINNTALGVAKPVVAPPQVFVPDWVVSQENHNPLLPPFVTAQPLNPNNWPWTTLKEPKALRQDPVQTRAAVARDARRDRRLGGN